MGDHLDDNTAAELVSGALSALALARAERHLAGCRDCRALVAALAADGGDDSGARTYRHEPLTASQVQPMPRRTLTIGDRVHRYLVLSPVGAGGMGVVFAAYDPNLGRKIALKLVRSGVAGSKDARSRLRREAQAIAQLSHPNVVSVYDVGTTDEGDLYIAMEFVEGDTLTSWLKNYPRTPREIIDTFVQAARGLASAHSVGLLHRDFKPDNVLVGGDGRVRVTDFGLARSLLAPDESLPTKSMTPALNQALTATGTVLGTPRYMPPEQTIGVDLDARSDQFSFCVALYEALYGRHPLRDGTAQWMLERGDKPMPVPEGTKVPAAIGHAVLRGLSGDRTKRFGSMTALIDELVPRPRRSPVRYAGWALAGLLVAGSAAIATQSVQPVADAAAPRVDLPTLRAENDQLRTQLAASQGKLAERDAVIADLNQQLRVRDDDIRRLTSPSDELIEVDSPGAPAAATGKKPARLASPQTGSSPAQPYSKILSDALAPVRRSVRGCFEEWIERRRDRSEAFEATLVVGLTITPEGIGELPRILSTPDEHPRRPPGGPGPSVFEQCVSEQIARARFPRGQVQLDVEVTVLWSSGSLDLWPRVVSSRVADGRG